jgi:heat-inducible transcriptional repressor
MNPELPPRARVLLKVLIEHYIADGQPVGSRTLSRCSGLDLSPASIRNIMADLEEHGFIASPHTSAGRIPTPRGYRLFVDSLLTMRPLDDPERNRIESTLQPSDPKGLIASTASLLSQLTCFAGVVGTPRRREPTFRQIEFLRLSDSRILLIIVSTDGEVQNRILFPSRSFSQDELTHAAQHFNAHFAGLSLHAARDRLQHELSSLKTDISQLMELAIAAGSTPENDPDYVLRGETNLLNQPEISHDIDRMRELFRLFEQRNQLMHLLDMGQNAGGIQIFIGAESGVSTLDECSVITAPYTAHGEVVGTLGVIGPTRMAYERVIPIVDITARLLSHALSHP